jgi:hypothetical protein
MEIDYLFDLLKQSDISLLGYTFKQERLKDEIISKLPHVVIPEIDSSFSFKSFLRDLKIDSILETGYSVRNPEYIVLDLNDIRYKSSSVLFDKQYQIKRTVEKIREDIYSGTPSYKLLMLTSLYKSGTNTDNFDITNFMSGSGPIYMSDLSLVMQENSIKVIKNRFGNDGDDILISFDKLKEYNYICNYEHNN